jgi:hypothetical protein
MAAAAVRGAGGAGGMTPRRARQSSVHEDAHMMRMAAAEVARERQHATGEQGRPRSPAGEEASVRRIWDAVCDSPGAGGGGDSPSSSIGSVSTSGVARLLERIGGAPASRGAVAALQAELGGGSEAEFGAWWRAQSEDVRERLAVFTHADGLHAASWAASHIEARREVAYERWQDTPEGSWHGHGGTATPTVSAVRAGGEQRRGEGTLSAAEELDEVAHRCDEAISCGRAEGGGETELCSGEALLAARERVHGALERAEALSASSDAAYHRLAGRLKCARCACLCAG